jgi:hypothetical protein
MQWSSLDLKNLAAAFDDMADALLDFRKQNAANLTQLQKNQLTAQYGQLVSYGEELENEAVNNALIDIDGAVTDLQNAAHDANHALQVISNVQKAIGIAVAAVALGAAILTPTPTTIAASLNTLVQAIQDATAKSTSGTASPSSAGSS